MSTRHGLCLLVLAATLALTTSAHAQSYYWRESTGAKATYIFRYQATLSPGTNNTFGTTALSPGADTVMYILDASNSTELVYNDDYNGQLRSQIQYNVPAGGGNVVINIWVMAKSNASGGNGGPECGQLGEMCFNFTVNAISQGRHRLGGYILSSGTVNTAATDTMETVLVNNGAAATTLALFRWDGTHYRFVTWNISGGIGNASKVQGTSYSNERWVIGTPQEATRDGSVRVVRNDAAAGPSSDDDSDGLGNALELEACTCSNSGTYSCSVGGVYSCSTGIVNKRDTDNDGLTDQHELLGDGNLYLPAFGASPRHRDIFLEVDHEPNAPLLTENQAIAAAAPYANLPIPNLDGISGVSLHIDIGGPCVNEPGDRENRTTICGNYGGVNAYSISPNQENCSQDYQANVSSLKAGKFHWIWRAPGYGSGATLGLPSLCSYVQSNVGDYGAELISHELGHQLGLSHFGIGPVGQANRKPHYASLMNYTYQSRFNGSAANRQFSTGVRGTLNPRSLSETTAWGGSESIEFLLRNDGPYDFDGDPVTKRVDWNRDGVYDSSVRAHVVGQPRARTNGKELPTMAGVEDLPEQFHHLLTDVSVGSVYASPYLWVVGNDRVFGNTLFIARKGSGAWTGFSQISSSPTFRTDSGPTLVAYGGGFYIFGTKTSNSIGYAAFDASGQLQGSWSNLAPPPGVLFKEVNATASDGNIYIVGADANSAPTGAVWTNRFNGVFWQGWTSVTLAGQTIVSGGIGVSVTPGLAAGPDGKLYLFVRSAPLSARDGDLDMFLFDPSTGVWSQTQATWDNPSCEVIGRIGAMFRRHVTGAGAPLASGNGALWVWYTVDCGDGEPARTLYRWTWDAFNATQPVTNMGKWHESQMGSNAAGSLTCGDLDNSTQAQEKLVGVSLANPPDGLAAFVVHTGDASCSENVMYIPHADGQGSPANLPSDYDDGAFIKSNLCISLHALDDCGVCVTGGATCAPVVVTPHEPCEVP